jgi:hypothetical protein
VCHRFSSWSLYTTSFSNDKGFVKTRFGFRLGTHGSNRSRKQASLPTGLRDGEGVPGKLFSPTEQYVQPIVTPSYRRERTRPCVRAQQGRPTVAAANPALHWWALEGIKGCRAGEAMVPWVKAKGNSTDDADLGS